jgi:IS4 transposase
MRKFMGIRDRRGPGLAVRTDANGPTPIHIQDLDDGSWLAHLRKSTDRRSEPMLVRVVDYTVDDGRDNLSGYRLFTTMLDPNEVSAVELAAAYHQRWEIELTFDELRTHQRGPRTALRSKSPDLVHQEIWGHLCCHYAIRTLMTEAAGHSGHDPDRVSFVAALRIARSSVAPRGAFPPHDDEANDELWRTALRRLLQRLNPARRLRASPRVIMNRRGFSAVLIWG